MKKEIRIALTAILAIVVVWLGINFLKGRSLAQGKLYYATFNNINGLTTSNPIMANGYRVGTVQTVSYDYQHPGHIVVGFSVDNQMVIPAGTTAQIDSDLMGNVNMTLLLPTSTAETLQAGDTIPGSLYTGALSQAAQLIPIVEQILPKIDSIARSINQIVADPAIKNTLHNADDITTQLTTTTRELNVLLATANQQMPSLVSKAQNVMTNAEQVSQQLANADIEKTLQQLELTVANLKEITQKLNTKEGSAGQLINDPTLYNNLTETLQAADALLKDVKANPKRYINVSVFGRKQK